jgi:hypothetical protein
MDPYAGVNVWILGGSRLDVWDSKNNILKSEGTICIKGARKLVYLFFVGVSMLSL